MKANEARTAGLGRVQKQKPGVRFPSPEGGMLPARSQHAVLGAQDHVRANAKPWASRTEETCRRHLAHLQARGCKYTAKALG